MAAANTTIQLKKSGISGHAPSSLNYGEVAINYADGKLYYLNALGAISSITTGSGSGTTNSFATIIANGSIILAASNNDILSFTSTNGISITTNTVSKTINFSDATTFNLANGKTYTWQQNTVPSGANTSDLWLHTDTGKMYENINGTWFEFGPTPGNTGNNTGVMAITLNTFQGDGVTTTFTLTQAPALANNVIVAVDGITQIQNSYNVSANTITFSQAPYYGSTVEARILNGTVVFTSNTIYANDIILNGVDLKYGLNGTIDLNMTNVTSNIVISTGYNGLSVGPILINNGVGVTIPNGQRWVII